jgi:hypothetical protein
MPPMNELEFEQMSRSITNPRPQPRISMESGSAEPLLLGSCVNRGAGTPMDTVVPRNDPRNASNSVIIAFIQVYHVDTSEAALASAISPRVPRGHRQRGRVLDQEHLQSHYPRFRRHNRAKLPAVLDSGRQ